MKDGLPFTPWAADLKKKRMADISKDNPDAHCLPMGNMQFETHPQPRKMIQTPDLLLIIYEANGGLRQVFLDGRPLPQVDAGVHLDEAYRLLLAGNSGVLATSGGAVVDIITRIDLIEYWNRPRRG